MIHRNFHPMKYFFRCHFHIDGLFMEDTGATAEIPEKKTHQSIAPFR